MKVMAQIAMVMNLDKCIGCHTCSVTCKQAWTNRDGTEYIWFNNVETKPGIGYSKRWEDQEKYRGRWKLKHGKLTPSLGGRAHLLSTIFANPRMPGLQDHYEPWTYEYEKLTTYHSQPSRRLSDERTRDFLLGNLPLYLHEPVHRRIGVAVVSRPVRMDFTLLPAVRIYPAATRIAAVMTVAGLFILLYRRFRVRGVREATTRADKIMYVFLTIPILLGAWATLYNQVFGQSPAGAAGYDYRETISPWLRSLFYFHPKVSLMADVPVSFKMHIVAGFLLFALLPLTRLVHIFSAPMGYTTRPYVVYRSREPHISAAKPARGWDKPRTAQRFEE